MLLRPTGSAACSSASRLVTGAMANKPARIVWAVLARGEPCRSLAAI
jgi:hypothetical protein